jgi:galactonate dehydratase
VNWDILGKQLGVPVYKLLGGAVRDKVRMYTHLGGGEMSTVYESFDASRVIELALEVVARGYTAVKVVFVPYSEPLMGAQYAKKLAAVMGRLREAVGDGVDIMVDFHGRTYPAVAIEYINAIAEYRPYFCEEPVPPENIDALAEVCRAVRVPIATGERLATRHQFREVLEKRAAHVDPAGPVPFRRAAGSQENLGDGEAYYVGVAPHNPLGPIANAAALHFALATPNFLIQEDMLADVRWRWEVVESSLRTGNGYWLPTDASGLGVRVNEEAAARHPFQQQVLQSAVYAGDGAVLDWRFGALP